MIRALALIAVLAAGCFRGALGEACDPPRSVSAASQDPTVLRQANCQAQGSICCRRSANAKSAICSYPEDCYVAPYKGSCTLAVDCHDGQDCMDGTCVCPGGAAPCASDQGSVCCAAGQICVAGACEDTGDGGR